MRRLGDEPKVEITLKEVYDTVMATHIAVTGIGPRLRAVEVEAENAMQVANEANTRSKENRRYLVWIGRAFATIMTGSFIALLGAWATAHWWKWG